MTVCQRRPEELCAFSRLYVASTMELSPQAGVTGSWVTSPSPSHLSGPRGLFFEEDDFRVYVSVGADVWVFGGQEEALGPLELELQVALSKCWELNSGLL